MLIFILAFCTLYGNQIFNISNRNLSERKNEMAKK